MPIFQSSTFEYSGEGDYHDIRYIRLNNTPNHLALHGLIAALEGAEAGLVTASGMAAISMALLGLLSAGDHVIAHDCLYGGTHDFFTKDLAALGVSCTFVDASRPESWASAATARTRVFYVEAITNPLLEVVALPEVARFSRERGLVSIIDSTLATPVNFRPIEHGFDLVVHSATKYLNGHSDIVAGALAGSADHVLAAKRKLDHFGGSLDPHACFLLHRGLKTLALRVRHQNESALALARFLERHPAVRKVNYPGLEGSAGAARARSLFAGFGGMVSFEPAGGVGAAEAFFRRAKLAICAPSLGGPETLITRPATTSHVGLSVEERGRLGITDGLVRVSVGLEATEDLLADFGAALG
jgi:cystathionine gamma-synthase/cystathionine gamma-lyase/cystathionine beta-lyase